MDQTRPSMVSLYSNHKVTLMKVLKHENIAFFMLYTRAKTASKIGRKLLQVWGIKSKMLTLEEHLKNKWSSPLLLIKTSPKTQETPPQVPQSRNKV